MSFWESFGGAGLLSSLGGSDLLSCWAGSSLGLEGFSSGFASSLVSLFSGLLLPPEGALPGSIWTRSWPTVTVSSSLTRNSLIVPASGALTATSICTVYQQACGTIAIAVAVAVVVAICVRVVADVRVAAIDADVDVDVDVDVALALGV